MRRAQFALVVGQHELVQLMLEVAVYSISRGNDGETEASFWLVYMKPGLLVLGDDHVA